jgi:hypothetical protein
MFILLFLLDDEGSGSVSLTNGSVSGKPKNIWILRIRIRNTAYNTVFFFTNLFVAAILGQLKNVRMIPDPGEILGVVEEAALPSPLQPPVQPHLPRLGVVLQVELVQLPLHVRHVYREDVLQLGLQVGHQHVVVQSLHAPLQATKMMQFSYRK